MRRISPRKLMVRWTQTDAVLRKPSGAVVLAAYDMMDVYVLGLCTGCTLVIIPSLAHSPPHLIEKFCWVVHYSLPSFRNDSLASFNSGISISQSMSGVNRVCK